MALGCIGGVLKKPLDGQVLTMEREPEFARRTLRAGTHGYALKEASAGELAHAVRRAAVGKFYLDPRSGAALATARAEEPGLPHDLTQREGEVLRLIALGHTNAEIADQLCLSVRTIEFHRARIQRKLGLGRASRAELVRNALDHGLLR